MTIKDYDYSPYGEEETISLPYFGAERAIALWQEEIEYIDNPFRYCGEYQDLSSGLIYLRGRYLDPSIGRFISEDPLKHDMNWCVYCGNNPVNRWDPTGYAWTAEDQAAYDALGGFWSSQARAFKREVDGATKDWNNANGDIYAENNARYRAVVVRQGAYAGGYIDDFDYTRGQGVLTFVGVHSVAGGQYHTSVVIMAGEGSDFWGNTNFSNIAYGGKIRFATIGAGPIDGVLCSDINREPNDIKLGSFKKEMINLDISSTVTINNLFALEGNFHDNNTVNYVWFPAANSNSYNSNSFTRGLLNAVGVTIPRNPNKSVPGWNKPLPAAFFGQ